MLHRLREEGGRGLGGGITRWFGTTELIMYNWPPYRSFKPKPFVRANWTDAGNFNLRNFSNMGCSHYQFLPSVRLLIIVT